MSKSSGSRAFRWILGVLLPVLGTLIATAGIQAVRQRSYDLPWRSRMSLELGPLSASHETAGVDRYREGDAVQMGFGLICAGAMLAVWGIAGLSLGGRPWGRAQDVLTIASLLLLLAAMGLIIPPWRILSDPACSAIYGVQVLAVAYAVGLSDAARRRWGKPLALTILAAGIVLDRFVLGLGTGCMLGIFCAIALAIHIGLLKPSLREGSAPGTD